MKCLTLLAALLAQPALANERTLTVTEFDRMRVEGSYIIEVTTGHGSSAHISGSEQAIERTRVEVQGQTLIIKPNHSAWGGWQGESAGPTTIHLTTPALRAAWASGASTIRIDRMRAASVTVAMDGSGTTSVGAIEADTLDLGLDGAGNLKVAGKVAQARIMVRGSGQLNAAALATSDLRVVADGSADVQVAASRAVNVIATGSGSVSVAGTPACTVENRGSGTVSCGIRPSR